MHNIVVEGPYMHTKVEVRRVQGPHCLLALLGRLGGLDLFGSAEFLRTVLAFLP